MVAAASTVDAAISVSCCCDQTCGAACLAFQAAVAGAHGKVWSTGQPCKYGCCQCFDRGCPESVSCEKQTQSEDLAGDPSIDIWPSLGVESCSGKSSGMHETSPRKRNNPICATEQ